VEALVDDGVGFVADGGEDGAGGVGQVLVELELHWDWGRGRSSSRARAVP
jgi:hypothetical protein